MLTAPVRHGGIQPELTRTKDRITLPNRRRQGTNDRCAMLSKSDDQLVEEIAAGDQAAMRTLFIAYHARVYRFLLRLVKLGDVAEDITTDVFLDVWRQAARFEGRSSVSTWLLSIARNKAYSMLRRRQDVALADEMAESLVDLNDTPEQFLQKDDKARILKACLAKLSPDHQEIIELVYYQEQSVQEVSQIVGIPESTVKTRMFYARKNLSEICKAAGLDRGWP